MKTFKFLIFVSYPCFVLPLQPVKPKSSFKLPENSFSSGVPISELESQKHMISRRMISGLSILSSMAAGKRVNAANYCLCEGCQTNNVCVADLDDIAREDWYNPKYARIFDTCKQSYLPARPDLFLPKAIQNKQIVCVGEVHSNPCHHKLEFDVVKSLSLLVPPDNLAIGLECFYRQHQIALDRFIFKHQDFGILKKETNWDYTWGFDINHYAKIFNYAAQNRIRLVGLNLPSGVAKLVGTVGLKGVPISLKRFLPEVDLDERSHQQQFYEAITASGHLPSSDQGWQHMYEAQTLWDEYMAETAANYISQAPSDSLLCVIAGVNHVAGRSGIPDRIKKRTRKDSFVIVPKQVEWYSDSGLPNVVAPPSPAECDWAWFTQREIDLS
mmetsp:Transcript_38115/g.38803  ORF Transcript_38115/g.38803 Transcript_38115/m.38803 type:complete len:385 (-) Transcript_38115:174-1328(-)